MVRRLTLLGFVSVVAMHSDSSAQVRHATTQLSPRGERTRLGEVFKRVDGASVSSGPAGPEGNFSIWGNLAPPGEALQALAEESSTSGRAAVLRVCESLGVDLSGFTLIEGRHLKDKRGDHHHQYALSLAGWRIERFEFNVHLDSQGQLFAANGSIKSRQQIDEIRRDIETNTLIPETGAIDEVLRSLGTEKVGKTTVERIIQKEDPNLVFAVSVATHQPLGAWRYLVDARTGRVVGRTSLLRPLAPDASRR